MRCTAGAAGSLPALLLTSMLAFPIASVAEAPARAPSSAATALRDQRLDAAEPVFGVLVGSEPRAYVLADLRRAGEVVHDLSGGTRLDVKREGDGARVVGAPPAVRVEGATTWAAWVQAHPDTSLWRRAAAESGEPRDGRTIVVTETRDYRTALGCTFGCEAVEGTMSAKPAEHPGVFVISGTLKNDAAAPVHHVVLRYELLDEAGRVVYRDEGFNRAAETLAETEQAASKPPPVIPLAPGATDSYRMLFLNAELPDFHHTRVTVERVY